MISIAIGIYLKLGEIWEELKWLFYGGENGFQGNRGNGKLLKRCQARSQREQQWKYWKLSARLKKKILQNFKEFADD